MIRCHSSKEQGIKRGSKLAARPPTIPSRRIFVERLAKTPQILFVVIPIGYRNPPPKTLPARRIFAQWGYMNHSRPFPPEIAADSELESLLTEQEYARITKRSVASVRRDRLLRQGCPYVKLGALVRYRVVDIKAHLERSLQPTHDRYAARDAK